jgi:hypothetical protein
MAVALALAPVGVSSADNAPMIGVPDFLVRDGVPDIPDILPGAAAADAATALLARSHMTVIARKDVRQAEGAMQWHDRDLTDLSRLKELAKRTNAAYLLVGSIDDLSADRASGAVYQSKATVIAQLFDATRGVEGPAEQGIGTSTNSSASAAAASALNQALTQAVNAVRAQMPQSP